jgi:hypothetical protein
MELMSTGALHHNYLKYLFFCTHIKTGFVSLLLTIYQALTPSAKDDPKLFAVLDFTGFFILFVAIFHVGHGVYIILLSLHSAKQYEKYHLLNLGKLLVDVSNSSEIGMQKLVHRLRYVPLSTNRTICEFKIIFALMRHTYCIPIDFSFSSYMSQCFEKYSLRVVTIGNTGWVVIVCIGLCNYLRIYVGNIYSYNCRGFTHEKTEDDEGIDITTNRCDVLHLQLFFMCGLCVNVYVLIVYFIGRMYTLR